MPIEFRCSRCQRLLRTADDSAGQQTKCPECGSMLLIPVPRPPMEGARRQPAGEPANPFAAAPAGQAASVEQNPYVSPQHAGTQQAGASPVGPGQPLDVGDVLGCAWHVFSTKFIDFLLGMLLLTLATVLAALVALAIGGGLGGLSFGLLSNAGQEELGIVAWVLVGIVAFVVLMAAVGWLNAGLTRWLIMLCRGENPALGEMFAGGRHFGPMFHFTVIWVVCNLIGFVLCVVPMFLVGLILSQGMFLIVDRNLGALDACKRSKDLAIPQLVPLLLLMLISLAVMTVASFVPLGSFVAQPFVMAMFGVAYLRLTGQFVLQPPGR